jgi:tRNA uridine 5-carboxymethylaminomethyl modification enzyme
VKEIDALGGEMGRITDLSTVQFRMLNRSKGPAVWSPRAQCDRALYARTLRQVLESQQNLDLKESMVVDFETDQDKLSGVVCASGQRFSCAAAVLCPGTFLNGRIYIGEWNHPAGRIGEDPALQLTENLIRKGFESARLKTGTPPRLDGRTIDYSRCQAQPGDPRISAFSKRTHNIDNTQLDCHLTWTSEETHAVLRTGFDRSPLFTGTIEGRGPRYCPSIEDKIVRFADKDRHQIFLEPEGWNTHQVYMNGFSSSLPAEVQFAALRTISGLERAEMMRPGYAVEYDFFAANQISYSLETKHIDGLFFAGQINGTTGYEEAAAQGLMAGINAARKLKGDEPVVLRRDQAYIGVLIDDLITKVPAEPYRMFTSRAEHRLILRQDNADLRLTELGYALGLVGEEQRDLLESKKRVLADIEAFLGETRLEELAESGILSDPGLKGVRFAVLLKRPEISLTDLVETQPELAPIRRIAEDEDLVAAVEMDVKYEGYIKRERVRAEQLQALENLKLPGDIDYRQIASISFEGREKLGKLRPLTIGQAGRIDGVSPADCSALLIHLKKTSRHL